MSIQKASKTVVREQNDMIIRTTYTIVIEGKGKIRMFPSVRIEDEYIRFGVLSVRYWRGKKKVRMKVKPNKPLTLMVSIMENRNAKKTEYLYSAWCGTNGDEVVLPIIHHEKLEYVTPGMELALVTNKGKMAMSIGKID